MKTEIKITVRAYPVEIRDERSGEQKQDKIVLDKARLQAASFVGMDDKDLIFRIYNRQGFRVLEVGKPTKAEITVNLYDGYKQLQITG